MTTPILLRADQEHRGVRTAVIIILFTLILLLYVVIVSVWREVSFLLSCVLSLLVASGLAYGIELLLKKVWPSGRALLLDEQIIQAQDKNEASVTIKWADKPLTLSWWFHLKGFRRGGRERRMPKDWLCVAMQLRDANREIIAYAFLPPKKAARWIEDTKNFHQIIPAQVYNADISFYAKPPSRPEISAEVLAGEDGRYWLAERNRWEHGFELTPNDFALFINFVTSHSPSW